MYSDNAVSAVSLGLGLHPRHRQLAGLVGGEAEHRVGVASARINTLGERVEDVFLLDGHGLSDNRLQIQVETELLRAIAV